jgi:cytochrome P450
MIKQTIITTLVGSFLLAFYIFYRQRQRDAAATRNGYATMNKYWTKEPFTALDFGMAAHTDMPFVHRHHLKRGHTFQLQALATQPNIATIAPANIREMSSGKNWGIQPLRRPAMGYFCGQGLLTTDGELWHYSRKLWKPTFAKHNLLDLEFLSQQTDTLLSHVPDDGSTVDLQPLLYSMVG